MPERFSPESAEETREIVADALSAATPLRILGAGTKDRIGRPSDIVEGFAHDLSTARLSGVSLYEPAELVLRAGPGTGMAEIAALLEENGQMLAFEPPDLGPLLGAAADAGTLGGTIAANLSGPRRVKAGAARDHFLGVEAVSGRGELFRSGGRVVKNVTGYDLCKLICGSWGTLGVMTEVTVKVLPAPERTRTVLVACDAAADAVRVMTLALSGPDDVSAAAWLPRRVAAASAVGYVSGAGTGLCALRVEGIGVSVAARCDALCGVLAGFGAVEELHSRNSAAFWREVRDVRLFGEPGSRAVWRISVPPSAAAAVADRIHGTLDATLFLDWGGGLVWACVRGGDGSGDGDEDAGAAVVRGAVARHGGHATLVRATELERRAVPVFQPEAPGIARLTRRLKEAFDPNSILNPGRMYEDV